MTDAAPVPTGDPPPIFDPADLPAFTERWAMVQQGFVDDPRNAVTDAGRLVGDLVQQITADFEADRLLLERVWHRGEEPSTEDLRLALQRYRDFFQRLLAV